MKLTDDQKEAAHKAFKIFRANPFDPKLHQLYDGEPVPTEAAEIADTVLTGYTYQGQLLRRPVVALKGEPVPVQS